MTSSYKIIFLMRNLHSFISFSRFLNESESTESEIDAILNGIGVSREVRESSFPPGTFKNIDQVFGDSSFLTRFLVAQASKLVGKDLFRNNEKYPTEDASRKLMGETFTTLYSGTPDHNKIISTLTVPYLNSIKPLVDEMRENLDKEGELKKIYMNPDYAIQNPSVKKIKAVLAR